METDSTSRTVTHGYDAGNGQLTSLQFSDLGTYSIDYLTNGNIDTITYPNNQEEETYTPNHQDATLTQSIDSVQQNVWTFSWAPNGLEKAVKSINGQPVLTQDFTTDPQGRILSMTYDTAGEAGYDGELYFHYDNLGNTTLLTDTNGDPVVLPPFLVPNFKLVICEYNTNEGE